MNLRSFRSSFNSSKILVHVDDLKLFLLNFNKLVKSSYENAFSTFFFFWILIIIIFFLICHFGFYVY